MAAYDKLVFTQFKPKLLWLAPSGLWIELFVGYFIGTREDARGVAGVATATPFFEPEEIRNFVVSFLRLIDSEKKILLHHF